MWHHVLDVNVISTAHLTSVLVPLLERSRLPKIIFNSSSLGSIGLLQSGKIELTSTPWYNSSKAALNMLTAYYAKAYPTFKVNASSPDHRSSESNEPVTEENKLEQGAVNVVRLAVEGADGVTGTFSDKDGVLPW